jgi:hypothetical protein
MFLIFLLRSLSKPPPFSGIEIHLYQILKEFKINFGFLASFLDLFQVSTKKYIFAHCVCAMTALLIFIVSACLRGDWSYES